MAAVMIGYAVRTCLELNRYGLCCTSRHMAVLLCCPKQLKIPETGSTASSDGALVTNPSVLQAAVLIN